MEQNHILIADDEEFLCVTIADFLRDEGYKVTIVHDGTEVLPVLKLEKVDLVLLDLMMPHMNGLETLQLLKKHYPQTRVMIVSGYGSDENVQQAKQMGADGFVNKPFGVETLMRHVRTVISHPPRQTIVEPPVG